MALEQDINTILRQHAYEIQEIITGAEDKDGVQSFQTRQSLTIAYEASQKKLCQRIHDAIGHDWYHIFEGIFEGKTFVTDAEIEKHQQTEPAPEDPGIVLG